MFTLAIKEGEENEVRRKQNMKSGNGGQGVAAIGSTASWRDSAGERHLAALNELQCETKVA